jgi:hypothetical protein
MTVPEIRMHAGGQRPERKEKLCNEIPTLATSKDRFHPTIPTRRR